MALCPFAKHLLIPPPSSDPRITARAAILHVDAGGASTLFSFFRDRSGGIESHFHIRWTGVIEQYRDTDWQADANFKANDFGISIETQGFGGGKWTKRQIRSIKRLLLWLHETEGIPLQRIPKWDGAGVGYHVQFGSPGPWTPVAKSCPGPERIKQYNDVLVPWMSSDPEEGFIVKKQDEETIRRIVREVVDEVLDADMNVNEPKGSARFRGMSLRELLKQVHRAVVGGDSPR